MRRSLVWSLIFIIGLSAVSLGATILNGNRILLGLDLQGGVSVVLQPQHAASNGELSTAVGIIDRRVNGLGVSNSQVARQGDDVVINLPGIKDSQQALKILGETATLYFRPVDCLIPPYAAPVKAPAKTTPTTKPTTATTRPASARPSSSTTKAAAEPRSSVNLTSFRVPDASTTATTTPAKAPAASTTTTTPADKGAALTAACSAANAAQFPSTPVGNDTETSTVILPYYDNSVRYVLGPADMTGADVSNAVVLVDQTTGQYTVQLTFTSAGAKKFDEIAAQRYACYQQDPSNPPPCALEAAELDGVVQSAPAIEASSFNGVAVISGSSAAPFTHSEAANLALVLKYGSLPVRFVPQSVQTVSATIGKDSLRAGLLAGIGGIAVVMIYMLIYYRGLGLIVLAGLTISGALLYSILALLSETSNLALTLAGVTGIIVSVGITVDSYVVYFERLKDEVRAGRTVRQSVERSFTRAFRTVLTADLVSFMAALILYWRTIGDVRGFAFTLGLSTLLDVFTVYFFIRPAVILAGRRRGFTENRLFGISRGLGGRAALRDA